MKQTIEHKEPPMENEKNTENSKPQSSGLHRGATAVSCCASVILAGAFIMFIVVIGVVVVHINNQGNAMIYLSNQREQQMYNKMDFHMRGVEELHAVVRNVDKVNTATRDELRKHINDQQRQIDELKRELEEMKQRQGQYIIRDLPAGTITHQHEPVFRHNEL
jgi:uncharacterized protein HemX